MLDQISKTHLQQPWVYRWTAEELTNPLHSRHLKGRNWLDIPLSTRMPPWFWQQTEDRLSQARCRAGRRSPLTNQRAVGINSRQRHDVYRWRLSNAQLHLRKLHGLCVNRIWADLSLPLYLRWLSMYRECLASRGTVVGADSYSIPFTWKGFESRGLLSLKPIESTD